MEPSCKTTKERRRVRFDSTDVEEIDHGDSEARLVSLAGEAITGYWLLEN